MSTNLLIKNLHSQFESKFVSASLSKRSVKTHLYENNRHYVYPIIRSRDRGELIYDKNEIQKIHPNQNLAQ